MKMKMGRLDSNASLTNFSLVLFHREMIKLCMDSYTFKESMSCLSYAMYGLTHSPCQMNVHTNFSLRSVTKS